MKFLEDVLDEVCGLFDSPVVHIGGDECPRTRWKACPKCQARVHAFDPVAGIPETSRKHVLGAEGCLWSEYIWTDSELMWSAFPRALALAEVLWTGPKRRSWEAFASAAEIHRRKLILRNINCAPVAPSRNRQ